MNFAYGIIFRASLTQNMCSERLWHRRPCRDNKNNQNYVIDSKRKRPFQFLSFFFSTIYILEKSTLGQFKHGVSFILYNLDAYLVKLSFKDARANIFRLTGIIRTSSNNFCLVYRLSLFSGAINKYNTGYHYTVLKIIH